MELDIAIKISGQDREQGKGTLTKIVTEYTQWALNKIEKKLNKTVEGSKECIKGSEYILSEILNGR